ncbi:MAG: hypothetical protein WB699_02880 [Bacteroidota bacterium]
MTWEQLISGSMAAAFALAFCTGLAHKLYQGLSSRMMKSSPAPRKSVTYVEVWECSRCRYLNRITQACNHCGTRMPLNPRFRTVPERQFITQLLPADHSNRNVPPKED